MTDELKPCPFCGGNNITIEHLMDVVFCNDCGAEMSGDAPLGNWNTRPIEDALRAQLSARDALIERLRELITRVTNEVNLWDNQPLLDDLMKESVE